jgi:hypothetical protein
MTSSKKRESLNQLVREWKGSGLSQAKYAAQHNLTLAKFRYWIKKSKAPAGEEPGFIQLSGFTVQGISLRYPNGVELSLPIQTPVNVLNSLIHFEARCSR